MLNIVTIKLHALNMVRCLSAVVIREINKIIIDKQILKLEVCLENHCHVYI